MPHPGPGSDPPRRRAAACRARHAPGAPPTAGTPERRAPAVGPGPAADDSTAASSSARVLEGWVRAAIRAANYRRSLLLPQADPVEPEAQQGEDQECDDVRRRENADLVVQRDGIGEPLGA